MKYLHETSHFVKELIPFLKKRSRIPTQETPKLMDRQQEIVFQPILILNLEAFLCCKSFWSKLVSSMLKVCWLKKLGCIVPFQIMWSWIDSKLRKTVPENLLKVEKRSSINLLFLQHLWCFLHFLLPVKISKIKWKPALSQFSTSNEQLDCSLLTVQPNHASV